jgi:uncharacterized membrane protein
MSDDSNKTRKTILRMTYVAIFGALAFILTYFVRIPYPSDAGYLNFGDAVILLISMALGPVEGALVGMLAGSMADLAASSAPFIPWTLAAKGLMGLVSGALFLLLKKRRWLRYLSPFIGGLIEVVVYFFAYWLMFGIGTTINSLFDLIQACSCALLGAALHFALEKAGAFRHLA